jgi:predicted naringenin-chalcone synthase
MSFRIRGMGTANPPDRVTPEDGLGVARVIGGPTARESGFLAAVYAGTGNKSRYMVHGRGVVRDILDGTRFSDSQFLPNGDPNYYGPGTGYRNRRYATESARLAVEAAAPAVAAARFTPDSVTHLITVSCTGFAAPGIDLALIRGLGLRPTVERTHVGFMGCHGALNGLRVANAYASDSAARVLLCAVELCSLHYHFGDDAEKVVANAIFADGAAAVVGDAAAGPGWRVAATGSCLIPDSAEAMTWNIGDHGFEMTLGKQVPRKIAKSLRGWLSGWLAANRLTVGDVESWAVHPGGPRIVEAVEEALGLPKAATAASREVFAEFGNMSSPTVLFILKRLMEANAPRPCVMLGFGPGLVAEAVLVL